MGRERKNTQIVSFLVAEVVSHRYILLATVVVHRHVREQKTGGLFAEVGNTAHPAWVTEGMPCLANCRILRLALKESKFFAVKSTAFQ